MTKEEKMAVIDSLAQQLQDYPHFYVTDIEALNAEQTAALRRKCFENGVKLVVVKKHAAEQGVGEGGKGRCRAGNRIGGSDLRYVRRGCESSRETYQGVPQGV